MLFFGRSRRVKREAQKEAEIQSIRTETFKQIDKRVERLEKTNKKMAELLSDDMGITGKIFLATGGDRRNGNKES